MEIKQLIRRMEETGDWRVIYEGTSGYALILEREESTWKIAARGSLEELPTLLQILSEAK